MYTGKPFHHGSVFYRNKACYAVNTEFKNISAHVCKLRH